jgi:hypothetical protein
LRVGIAFPLLGRSKGDRPICVAAFRVDADEHPAADLPGSDDPNFPVVEPIVDLFENEAAEQRLGLGSEMLCVATLRASFRGSNSTIASPEKYGIAV